MERKIYHTIPADVSPDKRPINNRLSGFNAGKDAKLVDYTKGKESTYSGYLVSLYRTTVSAI